MPDRLIVSLGLIKRACSNINCALGLHTESHVYAIAKAADQIWQGEYYE